MPNPETDAAYRLCRLCPRECGVDRTAGRRGACGESAVCRIASAGPHFGEEPALSGSCGSGTIFFSGCAAGCFFCQNHQISRGGQGRHVSQNELLALAMDLAERGVHNLNFVTPDHFWPHVRSLCHSLREQGVSLPFVWNSSGYQRSEMAAEQAELLDIFLPDFKFAQPELAAECMGDRRYPEFAMATLRVLVRAKGFLKPWQGQQPAAQGVLVRHLVLPGETENSLAVLRLLRAEFGRWLPLSLMSQFQPVPECLARNRLARPLEAAAYAMVCREAERLGFRRLYVQPAPADTEFLPDFTRRQPFRGNQVNAGAASDQAAEPI